MRTGLLHGLRSYLDYNNDDDDDDSDDDDYDDDRDVMIMIYELFLLRIPFRGFSTLILTYNYDNSLSSIAYNWSQ